MRGHTSQQAHLVGPGVPPSKQPAATRYLRLARTGYELSVALRSLGPHDG